MDLSIIILSFNTKLILGRCLKSILKFTQKIKYELVVVDNNSQDGSLNLLKQTKTEFQQAGVPFKIISNPKNLGFSSANNQGIKVAKGRFILLLNSDTEFFSNVLEEMVAWMRKNKKIGIASCSLRNKNGSLQATGGYFPSLPRVVAWMLFLDDLPVLGRYIKSFHPHTPDFFGKSQYYLIEHEPDWVTGAFFLIRKKVIEEIGLLSEDYFMYVEEVDYCYRAKKSGWKVKYLPQWKILHLGGASGGNQLSVNLEFAGLKKFYKKYYSPLDYNLMRFFLKLGVLLRIFVFYCLGLDKAKIYKNVFNKV